MTATGFLSGSFLATGIYNLDSNRFQAAPRDTRKEGWTESWGADDNDDAVHRSDYNLDKEAIETSLSTPHPQLPLILTQFRPAWLEQMVLRMSGTPFIVLNSNHLTSEAIGPLPYLRDHNDLTKPPVLVGRNHPSNIAPVNPVGSSHILEYLRRSREIDLDQALVTADQKSMSKCFIHMIESELQPILLYLRYEDHDAWEQVYRRQYLQASAPKATKWVSQLHGRFQASLERVTMRRRLVETSRTMMSVVRAKERAKEAYAVFELQLKRQDTGSFLTGTHKPSLVDAILWAHLAEALCDVHLVVILADFPLLVKYFQRIYEKYVEGGSSEIWEKWNSAQNRENAFQKLPLQKDSKNLKDAHFQDAIDLMQKLSLQKHDLQDILDTTKAKQNSEPWPSKVPETETLFYRWRMGEDLSKTAQDNSQDEQQNSMRKKLLRDQVRNDQVWISGVLGISAVAIFLLQGNAKPS